MRRAASLPLSVRIASGEVGPRRDARESGVAIHRPALTVIRSEIAWRGELTDEPAVRVIRGVLVSEVLHVEKIPTRSRRRSGS